jgi:putative heme-binding domain-containing protein
MAAGQRSFRNHCSSCHGRNAQGGRAPDLTITTYSDAELGGIISNGVPGTTMAAYAQRLGPPEINRIVAFIRSANRDSSRLTGDPGRGESLFWSKGRCGSCHGVGPRGTRLGPDLTQIGAQRSIPSLRESLTTPSNVVAQGFTTVQVVTLDGRTIRGIERQSDDFNVILMDLSGETRSFDRSDLRTIEHDPKSLMPPAGDALTNAEIEDVLAYLWKLRPAEGAATR